MAGIVLSTVLELSYQSDDGIRFKPDFFLVYGRYKPHLGIGISQVYTWYYLRSHTRLALV